MVAPAVRAEDTIAAAGAPQLQVGGGERSPELNAGPIGASPTPATAASAVAQPSLSGFSLPNGLRLIVLEEHSFPVVSCLTFYRVGSRNELPGSTGLTHVLEHLLFGSVGPFNKGDIAASIARIGGHFNGYTSDDFTTFFETLPAGKLELALKIEAERMRHAHFTAQELQEEIANVEREFETESREPLANLTREVRALLYLTHPYHNPTMGWRTDVENLTLQQINDYYNKFFRPDNCTIVIAGDVNAVAAAALVDKYFSTYSRPAEALPVVRIVEPAQRGERRTAVKYPGKQEVLEVAYRGPAFEDADAPAMFVLEKLLNATYAGRLRSRLVDAKICSAATAAFEAKKDPGYFSITCTAVPATANAQQKISDAVETLIAQLRTQPISDAELKRARNQAEMAFFAEQEGPYRAGFYLGYFDALSQWQNAAAWTDKLRAVNSNDIMRVSKRYFNPENRVVAWLSGSMAPRAVSPSKPSSPDAPVQTKPQPRPIEHSHLTGYKFDHAAFSPNRREMDRYLLAQSFGSLAVERDQLGKQAQQAQAGSNAAGEQTNHADNQANDLGTPANEAGKAANDAVDQKDKSAELHGSVHQEMQSILLAAIKVLPGAIGSAPVAITRDLPAAVEKVPAAIKAIPTAVGGIPAVIKELPSTVGSIPSAIKEIPGAISGLPGAAATAVKELPAAIGGLPGAAASTIKELPSAITAIPGAAVSAIKGMPSAVGGIVVQVGSIPGALGKQLTSSRPENSRVIRRTLKNGICLVIFPSRLSPIVQIEGAVRAGSAYDPPGKPGLSAVAMATFEQGTSRRGKLQVATQQEDLGLAPQQMLQFSGEEEAIRFGTRCLARDLATQLDLIAETLSSPAVSDADVDKAKQDVITDLKQGDDTAEQKATRALLRSLLAPASAFSPQEPNELLRAIPSFSASDVRKFMGNYVVPSATTIVLAGDIDPDRAVSLAEHAFAAWSGKGIHQRLHAHPVARHVVRTAVPTRDKNRTVIGFGQLVPISRSGSEFGSLLIADAVLSNDPLVSRVNRQLVQQPTLARALGDQTLETRLRPLSNALAWSLMFSVDPNSVPLAVQSLQNEFAQLAHNGVTAEELAAVKRYLLGSIPVQNMSTLASMAGSLIEREIHSEPGEDVWTEMTSVKAATLDGVNRLIKNELRPDQATLVLVGSGQSIKSVRNQVVSQAGDHDAADTHKNPRPAAEAQPPAAQ